MRELLSPEDCDNREGSGAGCAFVAGKVAPSLVPLGTGGDCSTSGAA